MTKLCLTFNSWIKQGKLPTYCTTARAIALSKEATPFPSIGQIRTIAITPAITKVFEKVIQYRLSQFVEEAGLIHPKQRGFRKEKSTLININELLLLLKEVHD